MKHHSPNILYFTLDPEREAAFWKWTGDGTGRSLTYTRNAQFRRMPAPAFSHAADLGILLDGYEGNLQSLHVLIDIDSIPQRQMEYIRGTLAEYPEISFIFDRRSGVPEGNLTARLFPQQEILRDVASRHDREEILASWEQVRADIDTSLIELSWEENEEEDEALISRIISGLDNTFDASNLRYAVKFRKYLSLKVDHNRNFFRMQDSRRQNLAICIDEDTRQNFLNSYILYTNGFRALPITTRKELALINQPGFLKGKGMVLRDFDLQFEDEDGESVDEIRGYKYCKQEDLAALQARGGKGAGLYKLYWNDLTAKFEGRENRYWSHVYGHADKFPIYFATTGPHFSRVVPPKEGRPVRIGNGGELLELPGLYVPACGIYSPFHAIPEISRTYRQTRFRAGQADYKIETSRKDHDHSTPLDIYWMVNNMIRRAERYYDQKQYILSSLVSGEAIEIMNGFHHRMMIKAYSIQAKAENAIAMDVMGGNEQLLARDARFRVAKIQEDIARFYYGFEEGSSRNVLNQIFSDCRLICKNYEHFASEDVFISAMGHLTEGFSLRKLLRTVKHRVFPF